MREEPGGKRPPPDADQDEVRARGGGSPAPVASSGQAAATVRPPVARLADWLAGALFVAPFLVYAGYVFRYSFDCPWLDDFDASIAFLLDYVRAEGAGDRLRLLLSQHNEHRIVLHRGIVLAQHHLLGGLDFRAQILIGNALWIAAVLLFVHAVRRGAQDAPCDATSGDAGAARAAGPFAGRGPALWALVPIPWALLAFVHSENMFLAMGAVQNYGSVLFSLAFLAALDARRPWLAAAWLCATTFTSGAGPLLVPVGLGWLALARQGRSFAVVAVAAAVALAIYFTGYVHPPGHPPLGAALERPGQAVAYFVAFLGSAMRLELAAQVVGSVVGALLVWTVFRKRSQPFVRMTAALVLVTAASAALARSPFGVRQALSSRYAEYSALALVLAYVTCVEAVPRAVRRPLVAAAAAATIVGFAVVLRAVTDSGELQKIEEVRTKSMRGFAERRDYPYGYPSPPRARELLIEAVRLGVFVPKAK